MDVNQQVDRKAYALMAGKKQKLAEIYAKKQPAMKNQCRIKEKCLKVFSFRKFFANLLNIPQKKQHEVNTLLNSR